MCPGIQRKANEDEEEEKERKRTCMRCTIGLSE